MAENLPACEAFTSKSSLSRCNKPSKGLITTESPRGTTNWHVCSKSCAEALSDDLRTRLGADIVEVSL